MIELKANGLTALISPHGAALTGLWVRGAAHSLVLGSASEDIQRRYLTYFGTLVGPVANRVSKARFALDGEVFRLGKNEGDTCLHSGNSGVHALSWRVARQSSATVELICHLAHGVGGFPGARDLTACYTVSDDLSLTLTITARSDRRTVMNIAHHPYWNLDGTSTIAAHRLQVPAHEMLPLDDTKCPLGSVAAVDSTEYDFRSPASIPTDRTLDVNLCLSHTRLSAPRHCATLSAPNAPTLVVSSTEPGLQIYNGSGIDLLHGAFHERNTLGPYFGIALEPQRWPDAPNHPRFPSITLDADETYTQITRYALSN